MPVPFVRAVVLNFNGGQHVVDCVEALSATEWPRDRFEVVVVDNASSDGSDGVLARRFPDVRLIPTGRNAGFPANNAALRDLDDVDYVALINNDAFVAADWLGPLAAALDREAELGAVCPKIVFAPGFVELKLIAPTFAPGGGDSRDLGVRVSGFEVQGRDVWDHAQFPTGFHELEPSPAGPFRWSGAVATARVPVPPGAPFSGPVRLRLAAESSKTVTVDAGAGPQPTAVGSEPAWAEVAARGEPFDVINNVGSIVFEDGFGADRGFLERDRGQFDTQAEVFSFCGGGVLLRSSFLADVGLLDERFFLYYEDTDLAWRGRSRGWRYRYVPDSVIRHLHAASSGEGSALFTHFVERNRLLMLAKCAPRALAVAAPVRFLLSTASYARRDVVSPLTRGRRPNLTLLGRRLGAFVGYLRLLPAMWLSRRRQRRRQTVTDDALMEWMVRR